MTKLLIPAPPMLALLLTASPAAGHPHVFATARVEIPFDKQGRVVAIRNIWTFDEAFSAYAVADLDTDGDGRISKDEFEVLVEVNMESLAEFDFFTHLTAGGRELAFDPPRDYFNTFENGLLTLNFTLPLTEPVAPKDVLSIGVFDPQYAVAFEFVESGPATLVEAPQGCGATFHPPRELDAETMAALAALPQDLRILPPDLQEAALSLGSHVTVICE